MAEKKDEKKLTTADEARRTDEALADEALADVIGGRYIPRPMINVPNR